VTSAKRHAQLPDTPTMAELGLAGFDAESWWGLLAPARTPRDIIDRMHAVTTKALQDPTVKRGLTEQGVDYELSSPEALQSFVEREVARWAQVIKENRISVGE